MWHQTALTEELCSVLNMQFDIEQFGFDVDDAEVDFGVFLKIKHNNQNKILSTNAHSADLSFKNESVQRICLRIVLFNL